jgi:hypothetical protein
LAILCATGCKSALAPEQSATEIRPVGLTAWETPAQGQTPVLGGITTEVENGQWVLRAKLIARDPNPFYSVHQAGGWSLQILFDTDQRPTGYAGAYDYETGWWGDEVEPFVVRGPIPECCDWGPESGHAGLQIVGDHVTITVPLSAIHDDGGLNWRIDVYSTVACDQCPTGVTSEFSDLYTGTTSVTLASMGLTILPQWKHYPRTP